MLISQRGKLLKEEHALGNFKDYVDYIFCVAKKDSFSTTKVLRHQAQMYL